MKKTKYILLGFVLGLGLAVSSVSLASPETIQAAFSKFNIIVNGEEQELETDPILYQGTTYLPVRAISGMLGYDVGYDNATKTIRLDGQPTAVGDSGNNNNNNQGNEPSNDEFVFNPDEWIQLREAFEGCYFNTNQVSIDEAILGFNNDCIYKMLLPKLEHGIVQSIKTNAPEKHVRIVLYEHRTYFHKEDLAEIENYDFSYKIGEKFTVGSAQIKVNEVYYTNQYREFSPGVGNKYAVINFDVYTEEEPTDQFYWNALNFCTSIKVDDKTLVGGISTNHDRISSGKTHTVECKISIPNDRTVSAIQFSDPSSMSREFAFVTVD